MRRLRFGDPRPKCWCGKDVVVHYDGLADSLCEEHAKARAPASLGATVTAVLLFLLILLMLSRF